LLKENLEKYKTQSLPKAHWRGVGWGMVSSCKKKKKKKKQVGKGKIGKGVWVSGWK
jgi:hypothetical protein